VSVSVATTSPDAHSSIFFRPDNTIHDVPDFFSFNPLSYIAPVEPPTSTTESTESPSMCNNKEDNLTQSQMLKDTDNKLFIKSQRAEIENLIKTDVMAPHPLADVPKHAKLISTIWSYRRKCLPDGTLIKHKARMCVNRKQQELGRDYWETYAPVASWATICPMLILSTLLNFKSYQIDYTQVFPKLDDPVFVRVPQGWYIKDGALHQHDDPLFNNTRNFLRFK
jgi:hypothetical protein